MISAILVLNCLPFVSPATVPVVTEVIAQVRCYANIGISRSFAPDQRRHL